MTTPSCHSCARQLTEGESVWADDVKVIEPGGVRVVVRYTCDECAGRLDAVTIHVRESTECGPDFCRPCSDAVSEWVQWPCARGERPAELTP